MLRKLIDCFPPISFFRSDAVLLVDAFDIHDESIGNLLGRYDGNVYDRLYEATKLNPLNQTEVNYYVKNCRKKVIKSQNYVSKTPAVLSNE